MRWSTKIARVAGIGIYVHWTFWLLIAWIALQGATSIAALRAVAMIFSVFACVVFHELGHALMARRYGIETHDITLLPIGGVARLERMPDEPRQELWVALAGPAVNVVIAAVLFAVWWISGAVEPLVGLQTFGDDFLADLTKVNLFLVVFNLIPAFPMDGGRVLRALLATHFDYMFATQFAASVGQGIAILFALAGLLIPGMWMMLFIALFVYLGAQQESHAAGVKSLLRGVPVRAAMVTRFRTLAEHDRLPVVLEELLAGYQHDFPVVSGGAVTGILTRGDLMQALADGRQMATVGEIMRRDCTTVEEGDMLERTFERMHAAGCPVLPVVSAGQLVGVVTLENVGEWMMIHSAMRNGGVRSDFDTIFDAVRQRV